MSQAVLDAPLRPAPRLAPIGYFQRSLPAALIFGAFFVFTLPLAYLAWAHPDSPEFLRLELFYLCGLGVTHFVVTPLIYLQSSNLRYFASTWRNRLIYFAIPIAIFVGFDLYRTLELAVLLPAFDIGFRLLVRAMDFQHFGRQSFGVLQLFKARAGVKFPAWQKRAEAVFSWTVPALLLTTFLRGGRFDAADSPTVLLVASAVCAGVLMTCFVLVVIGMVRTAHSAERPGALLAPATYFVLQTGSCLLAFANTALYGFALAMHFVEYHVLMMPRCCRAPLDESHAPDRVLSRLRRNRVIFYSLIALAAIGVTVLTGVGTSAMTAMVAQLAAMWRSLGGGMTPSGSYTAFLAIFDGIFVFHYFVEMFIWKFSEQHYRQTLAPLYFAKK
jgi:hypothetical protein